MIFEFFPFSSEVKDHIFNQNARFQHRLIVLADPGQNSRFTKPDGYGRKF